MGTVACLLLAQEMAPAASAAATPSELASLIDAAVERAFARRGSTAAWPSPQTALASPQWAGDGLSGAGPRVRVYAPPGPMRRFATRLGGGLIELGRPKIVEGAPAPGR
jgi:hypothetical protein